ncbi:hypothetical protein OXYTRIMIC_333 [Oxytricha trifallax]|uniref:Uncharacterized protein n=1 Tax=Oxytricha trifallax TaxID=1172189 RepID=A0A073I056_9SPIT|nr:hypothetical protein OXYTRIMIC_333 [Oxytricha trifallax]
MATFQYHNYKEFICNLCRKQCLMYRIFSQVELFPFFVKSVEDALNHLKNQPCTLQFFCNDCYNTRILNQKIVQETVQSLTIQLNEAKQEIEVQKKEIKELNKKVEDLSYQQKVMFSFEDTKSDYNQLELQINQFTEYSENQGIQSQTEKLMETFNSQKIDGLLEISKQFESIVKVNIDETKENIKRIKLVSQQIQSIYGDFDPLKVTSKIKMEKFIDEEIKSQNLDKKIELMHEIQKFIMKYDKEPQTAKANYETQQ